MKTKRNFFKIPARKRILLAPMQEVNDIAFRILSKKICSGFLHPNLLTETGMLHPKTRQKLFLKDKPILQLFGNSSKGIEKFMKKYNRSVSGWDFNLGCPSKRARKESFGAYFVKDKNLKKIEEILKTMRISAGKKSLIVKIRKSPFAFDILKIAEKYCDAISIHPRTKEQGYSGKPDVKFAEKIKNSTFLPVIYSGNVNENNYKEFLDKFDYLMIGRRAIGRPEIFLRIFNNKDSFIGKKYKIKLFLNYLKLAKKYSIPFRQIKFQAMNFTKDFNDAKKLRLEIFKCKNTNDIKKVFSR